MFNNMINNPDFAEIIFNDGIAIVVMIAIYFIIPVATYIFAIFIDANERDKTEMFSFFLGLRKIILIIIAMSMVIYSLNRMKEINSKEETTPNEITSTTID